MWKCTYQNYTANRDELALMPVLALPKASIIGFTCRMRSSRFLYGACNKINHFQSQQGYKVFLKFEIGQTITVITYLETTNFSIIVPHSFDQEMGYKWPGLSACLWRGAPLIFWGIIMFTFTHFNVAPLIIQCCTCTVVHKRLHLSTFMP